MKACGGTDGMGGEPLTTAAISVHVQPVVVNCIGWLPEDLKDLVLWHLVRQCFV